MDLTAHWVGISAIVLFVTAYSLVITEEFTHLRKSKPVILAAGIIWALVAYQYAGSSEPDMAAEAVNEYLAEFAQLFLFLLTAMTYVNAMSERNVFLALRHWLEQRSYTYRTMFWITGVLSFFLSPVIDNLTTALVMCAVVMAIGQGSPRFIGIACVNIVVAAAAVAMARSTRSAGISCDSSAWLGLPLSSRPQRGRRVRAAPGREDKGKPSCLARTR